MDKSRIKYYMSHPGKIFMPLAARGCFNWMDDATYLKLIYHSRMGKKLNLSSPVGFNEKIQWLKLYDRREKYIQWVDKNSAKELVAQLLGPEYVVPTIAVWDKSEDIDFSKLPDKCVMKCNHDQGSTVIFERANGMNESKLREYFAIRMKKNAYSTTKEWPYKQIVPKIICEEYLAEDIIDYKFFCFNGKPTFINIGKKNVQDNVTCITFLDLDWKKLPFQRSDFPPVDILPKKPGQLDKMLEIAEKLAQDTYFVRVDLYCVNERIYFSEFTLYPTSGFIRFSPEEGDRILGEKLILPCKNE